MNTDFIQEPVAVNDHIGMAVMKSQLNHAIRKTCSVVPDSLGDRLFRAALCWVYLQCTTGMTQEHIDHVGALLTEHGHWPYKVPLGDGNDYR